MKTVFFGSSLLGYRCCEQLLRNGANIVHIFTIPQEFSISYNAGDESKVSNVNYADFRLLSKKYGVGLTEVVSKLSNYEEIYKSVSPDFALAIGWYHMIPYSFIDATPRGVAGIHGSLLPKYRGNAPLVWAMINGEKQTGVSLFYFEKEVDAGDIIDQEKVDITENDTISDLLKKVESASLSILDRTYPLIESGTHQSVPQKHEDATYYPARSPKDGEIDWSMSVKQIRDFIRAQTRPYPGAFTIIGNTKITLWDADIEVIEDVSPDA